MPGKFGKACFVRTNCPNWETFVLNGKKYNIVLMNCDDLGYGDLGCYGSSVNHTPTLDKMAEEGTRLTDFYAGSPVCSPSRGGMLTGCYPPRIGFGSFEGQWVLFPGQGVGLNPDEVTLAEALRDAGYRTKLIGKWHCGDQEAFLPLNHGFDEYYGLPYSNDMGRQVTREDNPPLPLIDGMEIIEEQPDQCSLTERYVEQAVRFIRENRENPFFLYFAHMHVHLPLYASEAFVKQSENGDYGACVAAIDWAARCVLHELRRQGLEENTLFVFTSDNGGRGDHGGSNKPLRGKKGTTWEGGQRVPCIFYCPGTIPAHTVCDGLASNIDFFPTFLSLCGAEQPRRNPIDGVDLSRMLLKGEPSPRKTFFYYIQENLEAVRVGDWKLHVAKRGEPVQLLFNLREDPGETVNRYDEHPEVVEELYRQIEACRRDLGDAVTKTPGEHVRPIGQVENPHPLTEYNENHPYIVTMYDRDEIG